MALFRFTKAMLEGKPIDVYNVGRMKRDFTYIDDIVEIVVRILDRILEPNPDWDGRDPDPGSSREPWRVYNIGNSSPVGLLEYIEALEKALGIQAKKNFLPMQPSEVPETFAEVQELMEDVGFRPRISVREGIRRFVQWYREYYDV